MHRGLQKLDARYLRPDWQLDTEIDFGTVRQSIPVSNCQSGPGYLAPD
jgi:hypothetical protein